ncbi:MAG: hypothetical protein FJ261_14045 [Planctomycetes bacterium]|nr:hypothetical protein [Planctomycetota bacterium]
MNPAQGRGSERADATGVEAPDASATLASSHPTHAGDSTIHRGPGADESIASEASSSESVGAPVNSDGAILSSGIRVEFVSSPADATGSTLFSRVPEITAVEPVPRPSVSDRTLPEVGNSAMASRPLRPADTLAEAADFPTGPTEATLPDGPGGSSDSGWVQANDGRRARHDATLAETAPSGRSGSDFTLKSLSADSGSQTLPTDGARIPAPPPDRTLATDDVSSGGNEATGRSDDSVRSGLDDMPSAPTLADLPGRGDLAAPTTGTIPDLPTPQSTLSKSPGEGGATAATMRLPGELSSAGRTAPPSQSAGTSDSQFSLPDYEILSELGRGAMGVVYRARQKGLNRIVALKMILSGGLAGPREIVRFMTEAEAVAAIDHPNIVRIFHVGSHAGTPFFSLEFVTGGSLDSRINKTPQDPAQSARMVSQVARGMAHAHRRGIVHRDLKPANILIAPPEGADPAKLPLAAFTAKVGDFGLVKKIDDDSGLTREGAIMGTPSYMAPEQARGLNNQVGVPADIYAIGGILYDLLTGSPPFRGATVMNTIQQVIGREPVSPRQLVETIPADLATICLKCLEKDPQKRYSTADALADDLDAFLENRPISARPAGRIEKAWKWCRRNPGPALAVGALAALLVALASAGGLAALAYRARSEAATAQAEKDQAEAEASRKAREDAETIAISEGKARELATRNLEQARKNATERAQGLVRSLASAEPAAIGEIWNQLDAVLASSDDAAKAVAREELEAASRGPDPKAALRAMLALAPTDPRQAADAAARYAQFEVPSLDATIVRIPGALSLGDCWNKLLAGGGEGRGRLVLAAMLARFQPAESRWQLAGPLVADELVRLGPASIDLWLPSFLPVARHLAPSLERLYSESISPGPDQPTGFEPAAYLVSRMVERNTLKDPALLARLVTLSTPSRFRVIWPVLGTMRGEVADALEAMGPAAPAAVTTDWISKVVPAQAAVRMASIDKTNALRREGVEREARRLVALARAGRHGALVKALGSVTEPDLRSMVFRYAPGFKLSVADLAAWRLATRDPLERMNLLLVIGQFPPPANRAEVDRWLKELEGADLRHPSAGVHAAAVWLSRAWLGREPPVVQPDASISLPPGHPGWIIDRWVGAMTVVPAGQSFDMGAAPYDKSRSVEGRIDLEARHAAGNSRRFAIAQEEITVRRFRELFPEHKVVGLAVDASDDHPVNAVSWLDAVAYCQGLSRRAGLIPVYPPTDGIDFRDRLSKGLRMAPAMLGATGYRLPTELEWEMAARGGITTPFPCGRDDAHLGLFANTSANSGGRPKPAGRLLPGAWGLFDACGNAAEWTMTELLPYEGLRQGIVVERPYADVAPEVGAQTFMVIRGGSMANNALQSRFSSRLAVKPDTRAVSIGFRVCRTWPD